MHDSPRIRRLRNDLAALDRLSSESSVFQFKASGSPPNQYQITFLGKGLSRDRGKIKIVHLHRIEIKLGASYPRTIPEIRWLTPVYHPNISEIGMVCLGGYGTHWVPSVQLDELCMMLWDMARYHNYDIRSPYNRDAALWVANQTTILFPTDARPLRDLRAAQGRIESASADVKANGKTPGSKADRPEGSRREGRWRARTRGENSEARTALERVLQLIEQYGGGNAGITCSDTKVVSEPAPASTPPTSPSAPEAEPPAPLSAARPDVTSEPGTEDVSTLLARLEESSRPQESSPQETEVVILENWEDSTAQPSRRVSSGEEIVFID